MTKEKNPTRIILVRHGITDWIEQGILHGITDRPLSKTGLEQAREVAGALRNTSAKWLYTSPLTRTFQTAEAIAKETGLEPEIVEDLREMDYGWMEGKRDLWPKFKDKKWVIQLYHKARLLSGRISGEAEAKFKKRVLVGWEKIKSFHKGDDKIVVAHFGVIREILAYEMNESTEDVTRLIIYPCSISEIEVDSGAPTRMIRLNDCEHINSDLGWS